MFKRLGRGGTIALVLALVVVVGVSAWALVAFLALSSASGTAAPQETISIALGNPSCVKTGAGVLASCVRAPDGKGAEVVVTGIDALDARVVVSQTAQNNSSVSACLNFTKTPGAGAQVNMLEPDYGSTSARTYAPGASKPVVIRLDWEGITPGATVQSTYTLEWSASCAP